MKVAFSVGGPSKTIIAALDKMADDIEYFNYSTVGEMIKESMMRRTFFDRVILSENILNKNDLEGDLRKLDEYIRDCSENANIVLVCQEKGSEVERVFNGVFNSPMFTPVIVKTATPKLLLELVQEDIISIKSKYYTLEEGGSAEKITSRYAQDGSELPVEETPKKQEKGGFLKGIFGKKGTDADNAKTISVDANVGSTNGLGADGVGINKAEEAVGTFAAGVAGGIVVGSVAGSLKNNAEGNSANFDSAPVSGDSEDFEGSNNADSLDLGLGAFGSMHTDTGYLDEEELKDLIGDSEDDTLDSSPVEFDEAEPEEEDSTLRQKINELKREKAITSGKLRLVTGEIGSGVTSYIIDSAASMVSSGKSVLIIDLDDKYHGVLSYLDIERYFAKGSYNGLDKALVYSEDGIDVLSPGYGYQSQKNSLYAIISTDIITKYDVVFIDCPMENLSSIGEDVIKNLAVMIRVKGNKGSLLNTMQMLSSRANLSCELEDRLFKNSKFVVIDKIEEYEEDLEFTRSICAFGRGNWLGKITG